MRDLKHLAGDLERLSHDFDLSDLMTIIGTEVVNASVMNFRQGGFNGSQWDRRIAGSPRDGGRAILVDTGTLRDSIRYYLVGEAAVQIGVDLAKVPYAKIHNEGGKVAITDKMRRFFWAMHSKTGQDFWKHLALAKGPLEIPKRQFIGMTPQLEARILSVVKTYLKSVLN